MYVGTTLIGGLFLAWSLGANNSANVFGTAVGTRSMRFRTAVILIAVFATIGAAAEGPALYESYSFSGSVSPRLALASTGAAAAAMFVLTYLSLPASASQAAAGGMMGAAVWSSGAAGLEWAKLGGWALCWAVTPVFAALIAFVCLRGAAPLLRRVSNAALLSAIYKAGFVVSGCYGAYTLGANNVVVTTGPYFKAGLFGDPSTSMAAFLAALTGGAGIALGALTYSRKVMRTIGERITALDPFSALVAVFAHSIVLHIFTHLHVPVSSAQAIVGAVAGVGVAKGSRALNSRLLLVVLSSWVLVTLASGLLAILLAWILGC